MKNSARYGIVVLVAALLTIGCATADVVPSMKIGAYYDLPAKPGESQRLDAGGSPRPHRNGR